MVLPFATALVIAIAAHVALMNLFGRFHDRRLSPDNYRNISFFGLLACTTSLILLVSIGDAMPRAVLVFVIVIAFALVPAALFSFISALRHISVKKQDFDRWTYHDVLNCFRSDFRRYPGEDKLETDAAAWLVAASTLDFACALERVVPEKKIDELLFWPARSDPRELGQSGFKPYCPEMEQIWIPAARKLWEGFFGRFCSFDDAAKSILVSEKSTTFGTWDEIPKAAALLDIGWRSLAMTKESGDIPICLEKHDNWIHDASDAIGLASALDAMEAGVPIEDVLAGMDETEPYWTKGQRRSVYRPFFAQ